MLHFVRSPVLSYRLLPSRWWRVFSPHDRREGGKGKNIGWGTQRNRLSGCVCREFADQDEGSPEIGVGVLLSDLAHGRAQRADHLSGRDEAPVELLHQFRGALVMHIPQR